MKKSHLLFPALLCAAAMSLHSCGEKPQPEPEPVQLAAPELKVSSVSIYEATLEWGSIEHALSYEIYLGENENPYKTFETSFTITRLTPDTEYSARVKAVPESQETRFLASEFSNTVSFKTLAIPALAVPAPEVSEAGPDFVKIAWAPVENAASYTYSFNGAPEQQTTETAATFSELEASTEYTFRIKANPSDEDASQHAASAWAEKKFTTSGKTAIGMPSLSSAFFAANGFTVSWGAVQNAGSYRYQLDGGEILETSALSISFSDLERDREYTVKVCAVPGNDAKYLPGEWASITVKTKNPTPLAAPVVTVVSNDKGNVTLSWDEVSGAASYSVRIDRLAARSVSATQATLTGLKPLTAYTAYVAAISSDYLLHDDSPEGSVAFTTGDFLAGGEEGGAGHYDSGEDIDNGEY